MAIERYEAMKILLSIYPNSLFVSTIGNTSKELYKLNDNENNFYLLGSMGLASSFGFGIALSSKKHVIVLDGDGSILMNLGSLTTIGRHNLNNLLYVIFDNGAYETTGSQKTNSFYGSDLYLIAFGSKCNPLFKFDSIDIFQKYAFNINHGVIILKTNIKDNVNGIINLNPNIIKDRFRRVC